jgi:RNA polymerase sigma-32 factor
MDQETSLGQNEELDYRRELLGDAMSSLKERERHILCERHLKDRPATLEVLSQHYGISRERVRQIEVSAFEKLQKTMKNAMIGQRLANQ